MATRKIGFLSVLMLAFATPAFAAWIDWTLAPPAEGSWADPTNWGGACPTPGDDGRIDNGGTAVVDDTGAVADRIFIGYAAENGGSVRIETGGLLTTNQMRIGYKGWGVIDQYGAVSNSGSLYVGGNGASTAQGEYNLYSGSYTSNYAYIGSGGGTGTFNNSGGAHETAGHAYIGGGGGTGTYTLTGGSWTMTGQGTNPVFMYIGKDAGSTGVLNIGDADSTGIINTSADADASMHIRTAADATGTVEGWGTVALDGTLLNNGKVIANGYGQDRTLDMSRFAAVTVTDDLRNDKPGSDGANGWYAVNGGKLVLPTMSLTAESAANWGENNTWSGIDAVNSLRISADAGVVGGDVDVTLLATDRADVDVSGLDAVIGVWQIDAGGFDFGTGEVGVAIRYDDILAASLGLVEEELAVLVYDGAQWINVTSSVNAADNRIHTVGLSGATDVQLAVGTVPEPATLTLLCASGLVAVRRRRK